MKRYPEWVKNQVRERIAAGETQNQLSKELGMSRYSIQSWCGLRPETKLRQLAPMPKGRPKKHKTIEDYEKENKSENRMYLSAQTQNTFRGADNLIDRYIYFYNHERIQNRTGVVPLTLRHSA